MTDPTGDDGPYLEDLNVRRIRQANQMVDEEMSDLEDEVSTLQTDLAEKEAKIESLETEKEQAMELVKQVADDQRQKLLERIKAANETVDEEDEADVSALEEADVNTLEWVADRMEKMAEKASSSGVSNEGSGPDLGNVSADDVDPDEDDFNSELSKVAKRAGLGGSFEELASGKLAAKPGLAASEQTGNNDALDGLAQLVEQAQQGGS